MRLLPNPSGHAVHHIKGIKHLGVVIANPKPYGLIGKMAGNGDLLGRRLVTDGRTVTDAVDRGRGQRWVERISSSDVCE